MLFIWAIRIASCWSFLNPSIRLFENQETLASTFKFLLILLTTWENGEVSNLSTTLGQRILLWRENPKFLIVCFSSLGSCMLVTCQHMRMRSVSLSSSTSIRCQTSKTSVLDWKEAGHFERADVGTSFNRFRVQSSAPTQLQLKTETWRKSKYLTGQPIRTAAPWAGLDGQQLIYLLCSNESNKNM